MSLDVPPRAALVPIGDVFDVLADEVRRLADDAAHAAATGGDRAGRYGAAVAVLTVLLRLRGKTHTTHAIDCWIWLSVYIDARRRDELRAKGNS